LELLQSRLPLIAVILEESLRLTTAIVGRHTSEDFQEVQETGGENLCG